MARARLSRSGWRPSPFDGRDFAFAHLAAAVGPVDLPPARELPHPISPRDQAEVPCCASIAAVVAMEALDAQRAPFASLSPLFNYYAARSRADRLSSLTAREVLDSAVTFGVCRLDLHDPPFSREGAMERPSAKSVADAPLQKLAVPLPFETPLSYWSTGSAPGPAPWRDALAHGWPIVVGFWVTNAYWSLRDGATDVHGDPAGMVAGDGHAVAILGYDDTRYGGAFRVKDSRGGSFGDGGIWWLPYTLASTGLVVESWIITRIAY